MKKLFAVILVLLFATPCFAADYYVAQTAAGSGNGTSCGNADALADLSWGAGNMVAPGDTLHLCGTLTSQLVLGASGTNNTTGRITIKFEDNAKFSAAYWGTTTDAAIYGTGKSYLLIDGGTNGIIECSANGTALANQQNASGIYLTDATNVEIKKITAQTLYVRTANSADANYYGVAVYFNNSSSDISVHDCNLSDSGAGIYAEFGVGGQNLSFYNNTMDDFGQGVLVAARGAGATMSSLLIYNNNLHKSFTWSGNASIHTNGIHIFTDDGGATSSLTGLRIYGNTITGVCGTNSTSLGMFIESYSDANTIVAPRIYNNVFAYDSNPGEGCGNGVILMERPYQAVIANNTFYSPTADFSNDISLGFYDEQTEGNIVVNNLHENSFMPVQMALGTDAVDVCNYNAYPSSAGIRFNYGSYAQYVYTYPPSGGWKEVSGFDVNSIQAASYINSTTYKLSVGSTAIGAGCSTNCGGVDLTAYFTTDKDGNTRTGTWDIGAMEYYEQGNKHGVTSMGVSKK